MQVIHVQNILAHYIHTSSDTSRYVEVLPYPDKPIPVGTHALFVADECDNPTIDMPVGGEVSGVVAPWRMQGERCRLGRAG